MNDTDYAEECEEWLQDCFKVFSKVKRKRIDILCGYKKMSDKMLGRIRCKIDVHREIDPESLLLKGVANAKLKRNVDRTFFLELNGKLRNVDKKELREQVAKNVIVHELMHVERGDILETSKNYSRRKRKKIHAGLKKVAFERFNQLREIEGLPRIKNERDLHMAVIKIFEKLKV